VPARKTAPLRELPADLPAEVERAVRAAGALPIAKLTRARLGDEARRLLESRLVAAGLERAGKAIRVPLAEQIGALLEGGARVALKDLPRRIKGAARKEIDAAVDAVVRAGTARVVVRTQIEVLVGAADRALSPAEIAELVKAHAALGKVLKKVTARGRPRSLLRDDLTALLGPVAVGAGDARPAHHPATGALDAGALVAEALARLEDPVLKLARVPDLARALAGRLALAELHRALFAAEDAGVIELRPEAGGEFIADEDARLCPSGPRGTVLSHVRRVSA